MVRDDTVERPSSQRRQPVRCVVLDVDVESFVLAFEKGRDDLGETRIVVHVENADRFGSLAHVISIV